MPTRQLQQVSSPLQVPRGKLCTLVIYSHVVESLSDVQEWLEAVTLFPADGSRMSITRVHIATDHAGLRLSKHLMKHLRSSGYEVIDHGPTVYDPDDDYPEFCFSAAESVVADRAAGIDAYGVVLGGSGNGEQIAANKVKGARAALAWNAETARLAREHNDANIIAVGGRQHTLEEATSLIEAFLSEPFCEDERHVRRILKIASYENVREFESHRTWPRKDAVSS
jgi:ribose 5-phosphate isomerase B